MFARTNGLHTRPEPGGGGKKGKSCSIRVTKQERDGRNSLRRDSVLSFRAVSHLQGGRRREYVGQERWSCGWDAGLEIWPQITALPQVPV